MLRRSAVLVPRSSQLWRSAAIAVVRSFEPGWASRASFHSSAPASSSDPDAAATAQQAAASLVEFTPDQAAAGGAIIGLAAVTKLRFTGRILGVSGILGGLLRGDASPWRLAFLGGMGAGSLALAAIAPESFSAVPETYTALRAASAGLLVGLGTSLGSGCTSGHGICGIARLAPRSLAATGTFMASGMVAAALTSSLAATGADASVDTLAAGVTLMGPAEWSLALPLLGGSLATAAVLRGLLWRGGDKAKGTVGLLAEFASGATFAAGLVLSGMTSPAKVTAFLSPLLPAWDPSLAFVMGGALCVALPSFQLLLRSHTAPLCALNMSMPTLRDIDAPLLIGSALFGAGWGIGGVCPGPGLVNALGTLSPQALTFVGAMAGGMLLHKPLTPLWQRLLGQGKSAAC